MPVTLPLFLTGSLQPVMLFASRLRVHWLKAGPFELHVRCQTVSARAT